ncbi:MAG: hypothetical protein QM723_30785 [Myxococcaceae bacterium]
MRAVAVLASLLAAHAWAQTLTEPPAPPPFEADAGPVVEPVDAGEPIAEPPAAGDAGTPEKFSTITFKDGQKLTGTIVEQHDGALELRLGSGQVLRLDAAAIESVEADTVHHVTGDGKVWFEDPNRTRYFYSPSAMMLKRGEAHFSQKELAISSFAYGIIDYLSVEISSCLPAFFAGTDGVNVLLSIKAGAQVADRVWLAVGTHALALPGGFGSSSSSGIPVGGFYFGSLTYGDRDFHLTVSAGMPYFLKPPQLIYPIITVSGFLRVAESVGLMSENWFLTEVSTIDQKPSDRWVLAQILGVRLMGQHFATDLGFLLIENKKGFDPVPFPIPWVDFTYNF